MNRGNSPVYDVVPTVVETTGNKHIYISPRYLANKEYQMMEKLLKNPRCVLSAEQFIEAIWGYESNVENNVVWTYISRLRRILKQLDSHTVIRTAKGIGFALEKDDD